MLPTPSPEYRVLIAAARPDQHRAIELRSANLSNTLRLAEHHRLTPLLAYALRAAHELPDEAEFALRGERQRTTLSNQIARQQLKELGSILAGEQVPAMALKGAALNEQVYPEPGLRPMGDLDLLVTRDQLGRAEEALHAAGYHPPQSYANHTLEHHWAGLHSVPLTRRKRQFPVELHHVLAAGLDPRLTLEMLERGKPNGTDGYLLPDVTDLLIGVSVHFASDRLLTSASALGQLADVAWTIARCEIDWDALVDRARTSGLTGGVSLALQAVALLELTEVPVHALEALPLPDGLSARIVSERVLVATPWNSLHAYLPGKRRIRLRQLLLPGRAYMAARYAMPNASLARLYLERTKTAARIFAPLLRQPTRASADAALNRQLSGLIRVPRN